MSKKTIAKILAFVICLAFAAVIFPACSMLPQPASSAQRTSKYGAPKSIGIIANPEINESSGLAASKCQPDVYWTHNDSGDDAFIYAMRGSGERLGTWTVIGASNIDWEDIASHRDELGKCFLYIGDIGDNVSRRAEHSIYRIVEPVVTAQTAASSKKHPLETDNVEVLQFRYPDSNHDAETLLVEPNTADIYVITKVISGPAGVYRLKSDFGGTGSVVAEKIADISVPSISNGLLTGGDISPDGRRVVICDYTEAYEFILRSDLKTFDDVWKQIPDAIDVGRRRMGEGVTYTADGSSLILTSEGKFSELIEVSPKRSP